MMVFKVKCILWVVLFYCGSDDEMVWIEEFVIEIGFKDVLDCCVGDFLYG